MALAGTSSPRIVIDAVNEVCAGFTMDFLHLYVSQAAVHKYGEPFPQETRDGIERADDILHGASGISRVLGEFRTGYDWYANVRPIQALPGTNELHENANLIIIRENTEGLYSRYGWIDHYYHMNLRIFTTKVLERLLRFAFEYAL